MGGVIESNDLREAAMNIDWAARHLRLGVDELPEGTTREVVEAAIIRINTAIELLFNEAEQLDMWPDEHA